MDFGALPPEINSGLMYAGPGSAPMLAAAAAWQGLAAELRSAATGYGSAITELADAGWQGPSSAAMAAAAAPYVSWMHSTAAQAEQAGMQAAAAAAAHEAAFAATVPPPLIAANRTLLMVLMETNFMGQHTPLIAATEAQYAEMWAQDAAAMYAYSAASATATMLAPMAVAPATTNPAGLAGSALAAGDAAVVNLQGLATQAATGMSPIPSALSSSTSSLAGEFGSTVGQFAGLLGMPLSQGAGMGTPGSGGMTLANPIMTTTMRAPGVNPMMPAVERPAPALPTMRAPEMLAPARMTPAAVMGQAAPVGGLSVPASWPATAPEAVASSGAPLTGAAPMMAPRGIPAGQTGGMEARAFGAPMPARASILPQLVG